MHRSDVELLEDSRLEELKGVLFIISHWLAIPLYLAFSICDFIFVPTLAREFLVVRLLTIPLCLTINRQVQDLESYQEAQRLCLFFISGLSLAINYMIFRIGVLGTAYYAGLNLVAVGNLSFIPWSRAYYTAITAIIFAPYAGIEAWRLAQAEGNGWTAVVVNFFFAAGTVAISFGIRSFNSRLRDREVMAREALNAEIKSRNETIERKTEEAIRYRTMSSQFSPQVLKAVRDGRLSLDHDARWDAICAVYIDIVTFTEGVVRLEQSDLEIVIRMFISDTVNHLLKYDLTIDKFQGDSILAFSNAPMRQEDYVERAALAVLDVRAEILANAAAYKKHWKGPLQIRAGMAMGEANVGFYGAGRVFRTFTALGRPIPLAVRLAAAAPIDAIFVDAGAAGRLTQAGFTMGPEASLVLKGFDRETKACLLSGAPETKRVKGRGFECPRCRGAIMSVAINADGHYVFACSACDLEISSLDQLGDSGSRAS